MKRARFIKILILILFTASCEIKQVDNDLLPGQIRGYVQKGPYLNGSTITFSELGDDLIPTGKNYTSQILDNRGTFELKNVQLSSEFVEMIANGFYFNEIINESSGAQLTLFALCNITDKNNLNVNVLSNLEKRRVEYLVSHGISFENAKRQAQAEILRIFEIEKPDMAESESLDIAEAGEDNSILLAVSLILQGYLSVAELSELLANISTDIREDGILDSHTLGVTLINNAKLIKTNEIRTNLENRYEILGLEVTIPEFENYIKLFIDSTNFEFTNYIEYPESGAHGLNILDRDKTEYPPGDYSMIAFLPEGTSLKVKIIGPFWSFPAFQQNTGWSYSDWNSKEQSRIFSSIRTGEIDFKIILDADSIHTNVDILVYENEETKPTWTKEITILTWGE